MQNKFNIQRVQLFNYFTEPYGFCHKYYRYCFFFGPTCTLLPL